MVFNYYIIKYNTQNNRKQYPYFALYFHLFYVLVSAIEVFLLIDMSVQFGKIRANDLLEILDIFPAPPTAFKKRLATIIIYLFAFQHGCTS